MIIDKLEHKINTYRYNLVPYNLFQHKFTDISTPFRPSEALYPTSGKPSQGLRGLVPYQW